MVVRANSSWTKSIKKSTCFKYPENPACIDLILTNKSLSFKKYICDRDRAIGLSQSDSSCDENGFS